VIETVPNVSEGRRPEVIAEMISAVRSVSGIALLDHSADPSHNRSVFTMVGEAGSITAALLQLVESAVRHIDLRTHRGVHPRLGAVDVIPLVPLDGATMSECVELSRTVGRSIAEAFGLPVYLYGESAVHPDRRRLEQIRRGQFEGLAHKMRQPGWQPDFGPSAPHPTAGAAVVGARHPLIAYNVNLESNDSAAARQIAAAVRESSGGLPCVKALGLWLDDRHMAQVSMNLTDYTQTSVQAAFDAVEREAAARGVRVRDSELIGLVPRAALQGTTPQRLKLTGFSRRRILEEQIADWLADRRAGEPPQSDSSSASDLRDGAMPKPRILR